VAEKPRWQIVEPEQLLGFGDGSQPIPSFRLTGTPPPGSLPLTAEMLREEPSGNLFGLTQNVAMGLPAAETTQPAFMILSTQGGVRAVDGSPIALGLHTGHWEVGLLVEAAAQALRAAGCVPFAAACTDPCDGRSQGTTGMMDSLPYRNDAAMVLRRIARSLPTRSGVMGIGTCDKGLPAVLLALAGLPDDAAIVVPGGTTLPVPGAEDTGMVQSIGARFSHGMISVEHAADMGCRACGSAGGGCQFLGTAASTQVVAEALGLTLPHAALAPSGEPVWLEMAARSAQALIRCAALDLTSADVLTSHALENAMVVHAAFGGSTNLLLHIPAIAHAARLPIPTVADWIRVNRATPRLVDALPNGPRNHPTVNVFAAGGVPEVMLHLRAAGLLHTDAQTVSGLSVGDVLDRWHAGGRRQEVRRRCLAAGVEPATVIMDRDQAVRAGLTSTVVFPVGNIAPEGAVIKATAIDPSVVDENDVYRHRGPVRLFVSEAAAIAAIKDTGDGTGLHPGDVLVVIGIGPAGTGMEEVYQITSALKYLPWGKTISVLTDARFSGVSTGACIGHIGPEALAGGPIGRLREGDQVEILVDRRRLTGAINLVGTADEELDHEAADALLAAREPHPLLAPHPALPADTRLWAALQGASGGTWAGSVYDVDRITAALEAGTRALDRQRAADL
jgi:putative YjhG/YagF family dehydratase